MQLFVHLHPPPTRLVLLTISTSPFIYFHSLCLLSISLVSSVLRSGPVRFLTFQMGQPQPELVAINPDSQKTRPRPLRASLYRSFCGLTTGCDQSFADQLTTSLDWSFSGCNQWNTCHSVEYNLGNYLKKELCNSDQWFMRYCNCIIAWVWLGQKWNWVVTIPVQESLVTMTKIHQCELYSHGTSRIV